MFKKILIVDDNDVHRKLLYFLFEGKYEVTTAKNGKDGLVKFIENEFDLVITDYQMPVLDGGKMARWMKKNQPGLPIVMISAASGDVLKEFVSEGIVDYCIEKPFAMKTIISISERLLGTHDTNIEDHIFDYSEQQWYPHRFVPSTTAETFC